jgi:conjugal transfer pilin signal peptidase TrbI
MLKSLSRRQLLAAAIAMVILVPAACFTLPRFFCVALPPSLFHVLFWIDKDVREIRRGDYVIYQHEDPAKKGRALTMVKIARCVDGDMLTVDNIKRYFCNGEYIGTAKGLALNGQPLRNFPWNGPVPKGMILPMGEHKDSYDGRYYGFIAKSEVKSKAKPVFH